MPSEQGRSVLRRTDRTKQRGHLQGESQSRPVPRERELRRGESGAERGAAARRRSGPTDRSRRPDRQPAASCQARQQQRREGVDGDRVDARRWRQHRRRRGAAGRCGSVVIRRDAGALDGRVVASGAQVAQRSAARRDQPRAPQAAVGRGRWPARPDGAADDRRGLHHRGGPRPREAGRGVRLHQGPGLPPAGRDVRPDRAGPHGAAAGRQRWRGPRGGELPDRDRQPGARRRRDR